MLPDAFLSFNPNLELLNLNDNKITQLQPQLLGKISGLLKELFCFFTLTYLTLSKAGATVFHVPQLQFRWKCVLVGPGNISFFLMKTKLIY